MIGPIQKTTSRANLIKQALFGTHNVRNVKTIDLDYLLRQNGLYDENVFRRIVDFDVEFDDETLLYPGKGKHQSVHSVNQDNFTNNGERCCLD